MLVTRRFLRTGGLGIHERFLRYNFSFSCIVDACKYWVDSVSCTVEVGRVFSLDGVLYPSALLAGYQKIVSKGQMPMIARALGSISKQLLKHYYSVPFLAHVT